MLNHLCLQKETRFSSQWWHIYFTKISSWWWCCWFILHLIWCGAANGWSRLRRTDEKILHPRMCLSSFFLFGLEFGGTCLLVSPMNSAINMHVGVAKLNTINLTAAKHRSLLFVWFDAAISVSLRLLRLCDAPILRYHPKSCQFFRALPVCRLPMEYPYRGQPRLLACDVDNCQAVIFVIMKVIIVIINKFDFHRLMEKFSHTSYTVIL